MSKVLRLTSLICVVALLLGLSVMSVMAQDTPTGSAPVITSITPNPATINGAGYIVVNVTYSDADGDANRFVWTMGQNNMTYYRLKTGYFSQSINGTTIPVRFYCFQPPFTSTISLVVHDMAGNTSQTSSFILICTNG